MHDRFRNLVYGVALAIMIGWILHIGRSVFIPVIASIIIAYIIVAFARRLAALPAVGPALPAWLRYATSILVIFFVIFELISLISNNIGQVIAQLPVYQATLLSFIQDLAVRFELETEPTWERIRRDVLGQINLQSLIGTTLISVTSLIANVFVVIVYTGFLLAERRLFMRKLNTLSPDPSDRQRVAEIIGEINDRIGDYLAMKTLVNLVLGAISWIVLKIIGISFPEFWAVLIALLNYVPYVGSFLGVTFPVALALVQFGSVEMVAATFLGLTAAQILVGGILEPRLMGRSLNLSPFVIVVMLPISYAVWGIAGPLLAVPVTAIVMITFAEFEATRPIAILLSQTGRIPARQSDRSRDRRPRVDAGA